MKLKSILNLSSPPKVFKNIFCYIFSFSILNWRIQLPAYAYHNRNIDQTSIIFHNDFPNFLRMQETFSEIKEKIYENEFPFPFTETDIEMCQLIFSEQNKLVKSIDGFPIGSRERELIYKWVDRFGGILHVKYASEIVPPYYPEPFAYPQVYQQLSLHFLLEEMTRESNKWVLWML